MIEAFNRLDPLDIAIGGAMLWTLLCVYFAWKLWRDFRGY